jgi:hypothetical protein
MSKTRLRVMKKVLQAVSMHVPKPGMLVQQLIDVFIIASELVYYDFGVESADSHVHLTINHREDMLVVRFNHSGIIRRPNMEAPPPGFYTPDKPICEASIRFDNVIR